MWEDPTNRLRLQELGDNPNRGYPNIAERHLAKTHRFFAVLKDERLKLNLHYDRQRQTIDTVDSTHLADTDDLRALMGPVVDQLRKHLPLRRLESVFDDQLDGLLNPPPALGPAPEAVAAFLVWYGGDARDAGDTLMQADVSDGFRLSSSRLSPSGNSRLSTYVSTALTLPTSSPLRGETLSDLHAQQPALDEDATAIQRSRS